MEQNGFDKEVFAKYIEETLPALTMEIPNLASAVGNIEQAKSMLGQIGQDEISWRDIKINLDIYKAKKEDPVLIFHTGIGNYARFYYVFLSKLCAQGFNIIAIDRPGHGFSEGLRGDCTVEDVRNYLPLVIKKAQTLFNDNIGLFGTSLGGITTFYLLPDITGIKSAMCHNWLYPGKDADESKWMLKLVLKGLNFFKPEMMIPIRKLVDEKKVAELSENKSIVDYFVDIQNDPIYCKALSLRSVVSYFGGFRPNKSYVNVKIPVLGVISEFEKVLPFEISKAWWKLAGFSEENLYIVKGAKHMIFHDKLDECVELTSNWFKKTLG